VLMAGGPHSAKQARQNQSQLPHPNFEPHDVRMGHPRGSYWSQGLRSLDAFECATRLDDKRYPPVQAADVAAWITFQFANEFVSNPTPDTAKKLGDRMYKLVNWLDAPYASMAIRPNSDELPAESVYGP
jgi:hypothetical protein